MPDPPNILIYFIDELRADALGCYGHPFAQTPTIDRIAGQGMRFDQAISNCPLCMPARNCFFTGQYPSTHGVVFNELPADVDAARPPAYQFGPILRAAGYRHLINVGKHHTGLAPGLSGFTEHIPVKDQLGAGPPKPPRGIDPHNNDLVISPGGGPNVILAGTYPTDGIESEACQMAERTIERLDGLADTDAPWLLRVSMAPPHTPVLPPEPWASMYKQDAADWQPDAGELDRRTPLLRRWHEFRGWDRLGVDQLRRVRAAYLGMTSYMDAQLGRIEQALADRGMTDNLLTIFIADHGASIGDHGCQVKGPFDTDDIARVPLIVRQPGRITPGVYQPTTQMIDVLPTLAAWLGVSIPPTVQGRSLAPALAGETSPMHDAVFSEGTFPIAHAGQRESIRTDRYLFTRYPALGERELFDLADDPHQRRSIADDAGDVTRALGDRLDAWRTDHPLPPASAQRQSD